MVAILHSILPDHWVPLAVVARTQSWSLWHVGRVALLASLGHVITSLILGGLIALIGLQFQHEIETQQGHIVGVVLILTGIGFLIWDWSVMDHMGIITKKTISMIMDLDRGVMIPMSTSIVSEDSNL